MKPNKSDTTKLYQLTIVKHQDYCISEYIGKIEELCEYLFCLKDMEIPNISEFKKAWSEFTNLDLSAMDDEEFIESFHYSIEDQVRAYGKIVSEDHQLADQLFLDHIKGMGTGDYSDALKTVKKRIELGERLHKKMTIDKAAIEFISNQLIV